jgi:NAD dependent epimerase/dehydratase family enzyme
LNFSKVAAKVLHRPCFFPTPGWPMRLMLGEQSDLLLEGQRVVPENLLASGFTFTYPDAESALRSLSE